MEEYRSLDEAFEALPESVKKHSIRVAEYASVLFETAIDVEMNLRDENSQIRLDKQNVTGIYWAAMYHEIGLLALPESCREDREDMTPEERTIHETHVHTGVEMVEKLGITKENVGEFERYMILEGIQYHHEKWDGSGYPDHKEGTDIPLTAWLLSCADELDKKASKRISEIPFEETVKDMITGMEENSELRLVLEVSVPRLHEVFRKHAGESCQVHVPEAFVRRKKTRPMMLKYQILPCLDDLSKDVLWAECWFSDGEGSSLKYEELKEHFETQGKLGDLCSYFLYEAADMIRRLDCYHLDVAYVALPMLEGFMQLPDLTERVLQMLKDTGIAKERLMLEIDAVDLENRTKQFIENQKKMDEASLFYKISRKQKKEEDEQLEEFQEEQEEDESFRDATETIRALTMED